MKNVVNIEKDNKMTNGEIIDTIKYLNFCGLCTTGDCKNCVRKIAKDKVLKLFERDTAMKVDEISCCQVCHTYGKDDGVEGEFCPNCGQRLDWWKDDEL